MIAKCTVLLIAALMLANCCSLGTGCAPEAATPTGWDGLGAAPTDDTQPVEPPPKKQARAKREITSGPLAAAPADPSGKARPKDSWEKQQAVDQDDETRLKRTLKICSEC